MVLRAGIALVLLATLTGCATGSGPSEPTVAAAPPPYMGLASGSLGASLNDAGKSAANKAEASALSSGDRKTWRGDDGSYGYVAPGAAAGDCRDFTHTVYINGRPVVGKGTACKSGEGGWTLKG